MARKYGNIFNSQMQNARKRGIAFNFTYDQWVAWWEKQLGPNWAERRSKKHGEQYCMARRGDKGPYHPDNVLCITLAENTRQRNVHKPTIGEANGNAKLTVDDIRAIRRSKANNTTLAAIYKIGYNRISSIRTGRLWPHVR